MNTEISIIIPTKNGEKTAKTCLNAIAAQETDRTFEILIIDSGSTDKTVEIAKTFNKIKLLQILPEEFGHGKTRNYGAKHAVGKYLVFLNQDAIPYNNNWLEMLISGLEKDSSNAAAFSKHIPNEDCYLYMKRDLNKPMLFSTVSAAIRRDIWEKYNFDDKITIAEDLEWARKIFKAGFKVNFVPESMVLHSHNYSFIDLFRIKYLVGKETNRTVYKGKRALRPLITALVGMIFKIVGDIIYITLQQISFKRKLKEYFFAILSRVVSFSGKFIGEVSG